MIRLSLLFLLPLSLWAESPAKHIGVASCASSVCHGYPGESLTGTILRNEYVVWTSRDKHAQAYRVLQTPEADRISQRLGLGIAAQAKACLDCHTDNPPAEQRGAKFQINDGIGCEACHGGAEHWLTTHTRSGVTHADNVKNGLTDLSKPSVRVEVCLGCHVGDSTRFAGHDMMAAGHPRLSFELETFTALQPPHFLQDADYEKRKGKTENIVLWVDGLLGMAVRTTDLIAARVIDNKTPWPELALHDCHACHHPMNEQRMRSRDETRLLSSGSVRINDSSFFMLRSIVEIAAPDQKMKLYDVLAQWHHASISDREKWRQLNTELRSLIVAWRNALVQKRWTADEKIALMKNILRRGIAGDINDYANAEQAVMALEQLAFSIGDGMHAKVKTELDKLYASVKNEHAYRVGELQQAMTGLNAKL